MQEMGGILCIQKKEQYYLAVSGKMWNQSKVHLKLISISSVHFCAFNSNGLI